LVNFQGIEDHALLSVVTAEPHVMVHKLRLLAYLVGATVTRKALNSNFFVIHCSIHEKSNAQLQGFYEMVIKSPTVTKNLMHGSEV